MYNVGLGGMTDDLWQNRYALTFGNMPHKTVVLDAMKGIDLRKQAFIEAKAALHTDSNLMAIGTTYSGTSGSKPVLVPTVVDSMLYDVTKRDTPLASGILMRVANQGLFADYVTRTALPSTYIKGEGAALDATAGTYVENAQKMTYFYSTGEVTGPMLVASKSAWRSALEPEIEGHYAGYKELEEDCLINGNPTTADTAGGTTDIKGFKGLIQTIANTVDQATAECAIETVRTGIRVTREDKGHPNIAVTDHKTHTDLKGQITKSLMYQPPTTNIAFGLESFSIDGIPAITDLFMPTTDDEREFLILDTQTQRNIQIRSLQEPTFTELAKTSDSYKFSIIGYETMIMIEDDWAYRIYDIE